MEESPARLKKRLESSFTQRFESNEELKERLERMLDGEGPPGDSAPTGEATGSPVLPPVEELHSKLLSGVTRKLENPGGMELPDRAKPPARRSNERDGHPDDD